MSESDSSLIDQQAIKDKVQQAHEAVVKNSSALQAARSDGASSADSSSAGAASSDTAVKPTSTPAPPIPPAAPTLPIKAPAKPKSKAKKKGIEITMSKLSLFSIALSLIFFGALTFLGGFFIGVWFAGPSKTQTAYAPPMEHMYGAYPVHSASQMQYQTGAAPYHPTYGQDIPSDYGRKAGYAVQTGLSSVEVPGVPSVLHPLVQATRDAIGAGIGKEVQHGISEARKGGPGVAAPAPIHTPSIPGRSSLEHSPHSTKQSQQSLDAHLAATHKSTEKGDSKKKEDYVVQLGVFASPENANALVNHLENLNLISSVKKEKTKTGGPLYYVYSGQYDNYDLALKAASRFANYNIPGAIVVKSPSKDKDKK